MTGEIKIIYTTQTTLEANGASCAAAAFVQADDANMTSTESLDYPDADFVLTGTFASAPAAHKTVTLYAQPLNIDGTSDSPTPDASFKRHMVGAFVPDAATGSQVMYLRGYDLPKEYACWLENGTAVSLNTGWTLKVTPRTFGPV